MVHADFVYCHFVFISIYSILRGWTSSPDRHFAFSLAKVAGAYSAESSTIFGSASVGSERDPGYQQVDLALSKDFAITEGTHIEFRGDFLNALDMVSLAPPANNASLAPTATSPANPFGQITDTVNEPRNVQLALKFVFSLIQISNQKLRREIVAAFFCNKV